MIRDPRDPWLNPSVQSVAYDRRACASQHVSVALAGAAGGRARRRSRPRSGSVAWSTARSSSRPSAFIQADQDRFVRELVALTEIPAPPFKEQARAKAFLEMLRQHGLSRRRDGPRGQRDGHPPRHRRRPAGPLLVVNAHLDTVFPEGTDVKVKRQGTRLHGARRRRRHARPRARCSRSSARWTRRSSRTPGDILFVGNVGEEGEGDLRGVEVPAAEGQVQGSHQADARDRRRRHERHHARRRRQQALPRHVQGAGRPQLRRVRPGEPGVRDGRARSRSSRDSRSRPTPKTTYSVGVVRGGTSVNSIPVRGQHGRRHAVRSRAPS